MPTFEFNKKTNEVGVPAGMPAGALAAHIGVPDVNGIKDECLIVLKVYDACRQQQCLTPRDLGPARYAYQEPATLCGGGKFPPNGDKFPPNGIIIPPPDTASVSIDNLQVERVKIVNKQPSMFKPGFWDITLDYVFIYDLIFKDASGNMIDRPIKAKSIFTKRVTLFGSVGGDVTVSTDLFSNGDDDLFSTTTAPFVSVETKAIGLSAELRYPRCGHGHMSFDDGDDEPVRVDVTIGLFTVIKLFRLVQLIVSSKGFCVPPVCEDVSPLKPCDVFDDLDFPMDLFAPPQKPEFMAGVSGNISPGKKPPCGCE